MTQPIDPTVSVPANPAAVPATSPSDQGNNDLIAAVQKMISDALADQQRAIKGVITTNNIGGTPPTVSLTLSGDTTIIDGVRYIDAYSPVVGDTVLVEKQGPDIYVLGQMNSTTTSSDPLNGWTTIPTLGSGFTNAGASAKYRIGVDSGDTLIQWRGAVNISGTPTAVCTMPVGARPASNRQIACATSTGPAVLLFNSDGTVVFQPVSGTVTGTSGATAPGTDSQDTQSTITHSHGGAVSPTTITHDDGLHSHAVNSHTHAAGSFATTASPSYFSLEGVYYYL